MFYKNKNQNQNSGNFFKNQNSEYTVWMNSDSVSLKAHLQKN